MAILRLGSWEAQSTWMVCWQRARWSEWIGFCTILRWPHWSICTKVGHRWSWFTYNSLGVPYSGTRYICFVSVPSWKLCSTCLSRHILIQTGANVQVRVDVYDASDLRICSLAAYLYNSASAEAGPYLGTLLPSVTAQANTGTGWQPFSGILGQDLVGTYGKPIVLVIRQVDNRSNFQFSIDSVSYA